jgi:porphobilinogen synthase
MLLVTPRLIGDRHECSAEGFELRSFILNFKADFIMVKPISAYLDIAEKIKKNFNCILACYQVSGEYSMIYFAD